MNKTVRVSMIFIVILLILIVKGFAKYVYTKKINAYELNIKAQDEKIYNIQNTYDYQMPESNNDKVDIIQIIR